MWQRVPVALGRTADALALLLLSDPWFGYFPAFQGGDYALFGVLISATAMTIYCGVL
jgi:hypothetical protein